MLGVNMNISTNLNCGTNFKALYVDKTGMGETASVMAESLSRQLSYLDCIDKLDQKGIDTIIIRDPKNSEDRAMVAFIDPKNRLFKIEIIEKPNTCREKHKKSGRADGMRNI